MCFPCLKGRWPISLVHIKGEKGFKGFKGLYFKLKYDFSNIGTEDSDIFYTH